MTDYYSQLGFLVCCDASPDGLFRGDESRGYANNLFRVSRRIHDIADAMAGRGQQWPDVSGSHRDHAATAEVMTKAFGDWYARRHAREPSPRTSHRALGCHRGARPIGCQRLPFVPLLHPWNVAFHPDEPRR